MVICSNCCLKMKAKWHHPPLSAILSRWGLSVGPLCLFTSVCQLMRGGAVKPWLIPSCSQVGYLPAFLSRFLPYKRPKCQRQGSGGQDLSLLPFGSALFLDSCARCLYMLLAVQISSKLHKKADRKLNSTL